MNCLMNDELIRWGGFPGPTRCSPTPRPVGSVLETDCQGRLPRPENGMDRAFSRPEPVCTENLNRVDDVMELPKLPE